MNTASAAGGFLDFCACAHNNPAPAGGVGGADAAPAHNKPAGREVRPLDILHQLIELYHRVVDNRDNSVDNLAQVVRGDIRRHTDGDTRRAVDEQVRKARRQNVGLF